MSHNYFPKELVVRDSDRIENDEVAADEHERMCLPRRPRVWQQDDLVSHRDHSDRRGIVTYVPEGKGHVYVAWGDRLSPTAHEADELVEVPSGGDPE